MTDRDNITLPREVVEKALEALGEETAWFGPTPKGAAAITALRTHLAAEQPRPSEDVAKAWAEGYQQGVNDERTSEASIGIAGFGAKVEPARQNPYRTALAAQSALAAEKRHPDYVIGNHWFETAYERLCAGEAEDAILEDYELVREPRLRDLRRDAERYRWVLGWLVRSGLLSCETCRIDSPASYGNWWILRKPRSIDGGSFVAYGADLRDTIDAAMEASTAPASAAADASTAPEDKP